MGGQAKADTYVDFKIKDKSIISIYQDNNVFSFDIDSDGKQLIINSDDKQKIEELIKSKQCRQIIHSEATILYTYFFPKINMLSLKSVLNKKIKEEKINLKKYVVKKSILKNSFGYTLYLFCYSSDLLRDLNKIVSCAKRQDLIFYGDFLCQKYSFKNVTCCLSFLDNLYTISIVLDHCLYEKCFIAESIAELKKNFVITVMKFENDNIDYPIIKYQLLGTNEFVDQMFSELGLAYEKI